MRYFNTAGPVNCDEHYCLPPLERFDLADLLRLMGEKKYFVLHAPRQTGKTTCLLALADHLNQEGKYACVYTNVETAQAAREKVWAGIRTILYELAQNALDFADDPFLSGKWREILDQGGEYAALHQALNQWARHSPKPLVLLIDEIDALVGDTLIAVLRQLRMGYTKRTYSPFPHSIILCGVRDLRDYRLHSDREKSLITGGSAFNIKAESLRLGDFSQKELQALYNCHTRETGQRVEPAALKRIGELTRGQPWLVNALGYELCFRMDAGKDRSRPITARMADTAKEILIQRRDTHLDHLADKLSEERVRQVIEPMLRGRDLELQIKPDHLQYLLDLGLIRRDPDGIQPANAIYREIIPRELSFISQLSLESRFEQSWFVQKETGKLDMDALIGAFQDFFRQHSEHWLERFQYKEAGPQLLMQAFLQRIVNHGGQVEREYGFGRMRTDLFVRWPHATGIQKAVIELKIRYGDLEAAIQKGLKQTWEYLDRCGAEAAHLLIFDRDPDRSWEQKLFCRQESHNDHPITVWGM